MYVPEKARTLTIKHPVLGVLRNYAYPISITSGSVYEMKLVHGVVDTTIREHQILTEFVIINSEPSGADVYLNNEAVGKTPFSADKPEGRYEWRVERHLYRAQAGVFDLKAGSKVRLTLTLQPDFGTLKLSSTPESGADIILDGIKLDKKTPYTFTELPNGEHSITLSHPWYETVTQKVIIEAEKTHEVSIVMKPIFGELTVNAQADEEVLINNELKGKGRWTGRLVPGVYQLELRKPSHKSAAMQITVKQGDKETIVLTPTPIYGTLKVETTPMDAEIFLNGKTYGTTPQIIRELLIGTYDLEIKSAGYESIKKNIIIEESRAIELNETFSKIKIIITKSVDELERNMIYIEGGTLTMGCTAEQGSSCSLNEKPAFQVSLADYHIGKYEVTQAQWKDVMGSNPSFFGNCDSCPVENVSWLDVQDFIRKLNKITGKKYRLPTEAEWEFAARGGGKSRSFKYSGGYNIDLVAWYNGNSLWKSHPVGQKQPNELGLFDMSGNVSEWCSDSYYEYSTRVNPKFMLSLVETDHIFRGGSWSCYSHLCRTSSRTRYGSSYRSNYLGFRLVREE